MSNQAAITLVNYQDSDFDSLQEILETCGLFFGECDRREVYQQKIQHDPDSIILAKSGDEIVGVIIIIFDPWISFVYRLGVVPVYRQQGVGRVLAEEAISRLKLRGANLLCFFVNPNNQLMLELCAQDPSIHNYGNYLYLAKFLKE